MKIDAHQHFWSYEPSRQSWISDDMSAIKKDFFPEDLAPLLKSEGFDGCVAVQADTNEAETSYLLSLSEKHRFIKGVVGWLDLKSPDLNEKLNLYGSNPMLKGLRHTIQSEQDGFMTDQQFINGVALLRDFDLTYDILIQETQLEETVRMIDKLPEMKLVIDHIAKPGIKQKSFRQWAKWMNVISNYPHVYVKLSGLATEADWKEWTKADLHPYLEFCLESFGPERLMVGSDWPVCLLAGSYKDIIHGITSSFSGLTKGETDAILGENATEFYNLK